MLGRQDFTELFLTRSKARPRLLIGVKQDGEWSFYTMPQSQNPYKNSSLIVAADFHIKLSKGLSLDNCSYVSGLIYWRWRKIQCPFTHVPLWERICINGVLYYLALHSDGGSYVIVCFDVSSEKFKFIGAKHFHVQLINYKGKLCGVNKEHDNGGGFPVKLCMWILEDVQKQEWSKYVYSL
ncbi:unnamed protein product, partial [Arabidopsis halleri]